MEDWRRYQIKQVGDDENYVGVYDTVIGTFKRTGNIDPAFEYGAANKAQLELLLKDLNDPNGYQAERDKALYWLIQWYRSSHSGGYEEDVIALNEVEEHVCDFLFNRRLQPGLPRDEERVQAFITEMKKKGVLP